LENARLCDRRIPRDGLLYSWESPWNRAYHSYNEQSLITITGFNYYSFPILHDMFQTIYNSFTPYSVDGTVRELEHAQGRPRHLNSIDAVGIALSYYRLQGKLRVFGSDLLGAFFSSSFKGIAKPKCKFQVHKRFKNLCRQSVTNTQVFDESIVLLMD
jgi:hypothetical protein